MALNVSNLTSSIQAPINFVYQRGLLSAARKRLPYFNGTLPGSLEKAGGSMSVKWRRIENLAAVTTAISELTENGPLAFGAGRSTVIPTITDVTTAIAKYGNAIAMTEEVDLFNISPATMALMDTLGANAGESLNTLQAAVFKAGTTIVYNQGAANKSAVTAEIKLNDIKKAVNQLNRNSGMKFEGNGTGSPNYNSQPIRSSYYGICHSDVEEDIRGLSGFVGVEQYGGYTTTLPNEFGAVGGVRWASTEIAPIETNTSTTSASQSGASSYFHNEGSTGFANVYWSVVYGKEAVGSVGLGQQYGTEVTEMYDPKRPQAVEIIYHAPGTSGVADLFNEVGSLAWKAWWGGKALNGLWLVPIVTLSRTYN
jgi:N4-gp56 family major capsid protein